MPGTRHGCPSTAMTECQHPSQPRARPFGFRRHGHRAGSHSGSHPSNPLLRNGSHYTRPVLVKPRRPGPRPPRRFSGRPVPAGRVDGGSARLDRWITEVGWITQFDRLGCSAPRQIDRQRRGSRPALGHITQGRTDRGDQTPWSVTVIRIGPLPDRGLDNHVPQVVGVPGRSTGKAVQPNGCQREHIVRGAGYASPGDLRSDVSGSGSHRQPALDRDPGRPEVGE